MPDAEAGPSSSAAYVAGVPEALTALADTIERYRPPFFRGEKGEWAGDICDHLTMAEDDACDAPSAYLIEWKQRPGDLGTVPVSGCCERHARGVDRNEVVRMNTHPRLVRRD